MGDIRRRGYLELVVQNAVEAVRELEKVQAAEKGLTNESKEQHGQMGLLRAAWARYGGALSIAAGAAAAVAAAHKLLKLGEQAAEVRDLEQAFGNLATRGGVQGEQFMSRLQIATAGTVREMKLLALANEAMLLQLEPRKIERAFAIAHGLALGTGKETEAVMEGLTSALGRQSEAALKSLGVVIDAEGAYKRYAETQGTTAKQLTETEKRQVFVNEALREGERQLRALSGAAGMEGGEADIFKQLDVSANAFGLTLKDTLVPAARALATLLTGMWQTANMQLQQGGLGELLFFLGQSTGGVLFPTIGTGGRGIAPRQHQGPQVDLSSAAGPGFGSLAEQEAWDAKAADLAARARRKEEGAQKDHFFALELAKLQYEGELTEGNRLAYETWLQQLREYQDEVGKRHIDHYRLLKDASQDYYFQGKGTEREYLLGLLDSEKTTAEERIIIQQLLTEYSLDATKQRIDWMKYEEAATRALGSAYYAMANQRVKTIPAVLEAVGREVQAILIAKAAEATIDAAVYTYKGIAAMAQGLTLAQASGFFAAAAQAAGVAALAGAGAGIIGHNLNAMASQPAPQLPGNAEESTGASGSPSGRSVNVVRTAPTSISIVKNIFGNVYYGSEREAWAGDIQEALDAGDVVPPGEEVA